MAGVSVLSAIWACLPGVPGDVHGGALLLEPDSRLGVYARSPGQVQQLDVAVGQRVLAGQTLATINRIDQVAPGGGVRSNGSEALQLQEAAIVRQQQALRLAISNLNRSNGPIGSQVRALEALRRDEVIPRYSPLWVGAQDLYLRNQSQLQLLQSQVAALDAALAELSAQRASQLVRAPAEGVVLSLSAAPGQALLAGQRIATLGTGPGRNHQPRRAVALFTQADATRLRTGMPLLLEPQLQTRHLYGGTNQRYGSVVGRISAITPAAADLDAVSRTVGSTALATSLLATSHQEAFGEGGNPLATLGDKATAPMVLVTVTLEPAATPSGLRWTEGKGPDLPLDNGTPASARVDVDRRSALSYALPFLRWLTGVER
jgi:HlyD family secretion protein